MAAAGLCAGWLCCGSRHQSVFPAQPATALRAYADQAHGKRLRHQSRFRVVSVRLVGVPRQLDDRMRRDAYWLSRLRTFRTTSSSLPAVFPAVCHGADDHDGSLAQDRRVLAAVRRTLRGLYTSTVAARTARVSEAFAAGHIGRARAVS